MTADGTGHAVVVGAGLSGLLAAHVLAGRFARVTVVERDGFPEGATARFRPGVPQSRHVHILWSRGLAVLDDLVPGLRADLEAAGGVVVHAPERMRWFSSARWFDGVPGTHYLSVSRETLESTLRRRVAERSSITWMTRHEVTGPAPGGSSASGSASGGTGAAAGAATSAAGGAVGGVVLRERGGDGGEFTLPAEFVVVANGRGSRTADWLIRLGYPAPATDRIDAHLGYSSRYYRRPSADGRPWQAMYLQGDAESPRSGVIVPLDGERWLVTLIGQGEHQPPTDPSDWLDFAASLRSAELVRALADAEPLSDPVVPARRLGDRHRRGQPLPGHRRPRAGPARPPPAGLHGPRAGRRQHRPGRLRGLLRRPLPQPPPRIPPVPAHRHPRHPPPPHPAAALAVISSAARSTSLSVVVRPRLSRRVARA